MFHANKSFHTRSLSHLNFTLKLKIDSNFIVVDFFASLYIQQHSHECRCSTIELLNLVVTKFCLVLCRQLFEISLKFLLQCSPKQSCRQHAKFSLPM